MNKLKISNKIRSGGFASDSVAILLKRVGKLSPILIIVKDGINKVLRDVERDRTVITTLNLEDLKALDKLMDGVIKSVQKFESK